MYIRGLRFISILLLLLLLLLFLISDEKETGRSLAQSPMDQFGRLKTPSCCDMSVNLSVDTPQENLTSNDKHDTV